MRTKLKYKNKHASQGIFTIFYSLLFFVLILAFTCGTIEYYFKVQLSGFCIAFLHSLWQKIYTLFPSIPESWYKLPLMALAFVFVLPYLLGLLFRILTFYRIEQNYSISSKHILLFSLIYIFYWCFIALKSIWPMILTTESDEIIYLVLCLFLVFPIVGLIFSLHAILLYSFIALSTLTLRDVLGAINKMSTKIKKSILSHKAAKARKTRSKNSSSYLSNSYSSYLTDYEPPMTFSEKENYIHANSAGVYSYQAIENIRNDRNLTDSQKEQLVDHLRIYGV